MKSDTGRATMAMLIRRTRAYFAPVQRDTGVPAPFDAATQAAFALDEPPAPWIDLGWIEHLRRTTATHIQPIRAGVNGAAVAQYRSDAEARVEFEFLDWGKLQMALAAGAEHMNVLAAAAVPTLEGSTATRLVLGAAGVSGFATGDMVAVDADYAGQTGYIGTGIAGGYVSNAADVGDDVSYVRRVTFNVARVLSVEADALRLQQALPGGAPHLGTGVQKVVAFMDREGGNFFQEWSALFVVEADSGARVLFYYPRLQACAPAAERSIDIAAPLALMALHASFLALPSTGIVLCERVFVPAAGAPVY